MIVQRTPQKCAKLFFMQQKYSLIYPNYEQGPLFQNIKFQLYIIGNSSPKAHQPSIVKWPPDSHLYLTVFQTEVHTIQHLHR